MRHHHHHGPFSRHGFGGPPFRGGRGGGRVFDQGDLRWVVLRLIAEQPRHGYEIIKEIEDRMGGGYSPSPGVIYPTLTLLEELGYLSVASAEGGRKLFEITAEGRAQLEANQASVDALFEKMSHVRQRSAGAYPPPVARAIENLFMALRLKLEQGPLDEAQVRIVAEVLDTTAVAIERA
jgi:DNA-binding PadR family transcriptional regulator